MGIHALLNRTVGPHHHCQKLRGFRGFRAHHKRRPKNGPEVGKWSMNVRRASCQHTHQKSAPSVREKDRRSRGGAPGGSNQSSGVGS